MRFHKLPDVTFLLLFYVELLWTESYYLITSCGWQYEIKEYKETESMMFLRCVRRKGQLPANWPFISWQVLSWSNYLQWSTEDVENRWLHITNIMQIQGLSIERQGMIDHNLEWAGLQQGADFIRQLKWIQKLKLACKQARKMESIQEIQFI